MLTAIIDFSGCQTVTDLHSRLKTQLDLPDFYGNNLSALWDCLTGFMETPAAIEFKGINTLPENLRQEADMILTILNGPKQCTARFNIMLPIEATGYQTQQ